MYATPVDWSVRPGPTGGCSTSTVVAILVGNAAFMVGSAGSPLPLPTFVYRRRPSPSYSTLRVSTTSGAPCNRQAPSPVNPRPPLPSTTTPPSPPLTPPQTRALSHIHAPAWSGGQAIQGVWCHRSPDYGALVAGWEGSGSPLLHGSTRIRRRCLRCGSCPCRRLQTSPSVSRRVSSVGVRQRRLAASRRDLATRVSLVYLTPTLSSTPVCVLAPMPCEPCPQASCPVTSR